jgi:hypothetical protein
MSTRETFFTIITSFAHRLSHRPVAPDADRDAYAIPADRGGGSALPIGKGSHNSKDYYCFRRAISILRRRDQRA